MRDANGIRLPGRPSPYFASYGFGPAGYTKIPLGWLAMPPNASGIQSSSQKEIAMLTEIFDQWEILIKLSAELDQWKVKWESAEDRFQTALKTLTPKDATRLQSLLEQSLPAGQRLNIALPSETHPVEPATAAAELPHEHAHVETPALVNLPTAATASPETVPLETAPLETAALETAALETAALETAPNEAENRTQVETAPATIDAIAPAVEDETAPATSQDQDSAPDTRSDPEQATVVSPDDPSEDAQSEGAQMEVAQSENVLSQATETIAEAEGNFDSDNELLAELLELQQWAAEAIGAGISENELFKKLRAARKSSQSQALAELLQQETVFVRNAENLIVPVQK